MKKVLAISGSTRTDSSNWKILEYIAREFEGQLDFEISDALTQLPHFDPNIKDPKDYPQSVLKFFQTIRRADGILICTPEYVFSPPAILKNALEWTVVETLLSHKPTALIVASGLGEKTFLSLDLILKTLLQEEIPNSCKLLIQGARGKLNKEGEFNNRQTVEEVKALVKSLVGQL